MIAVSLYVGGGVRLIKPAKLYMCTQNTTKHNEDRRTAPGVCGNGSVPLSHSGTSLRELEYTYTRNMRKSGEPGLVDRVLALYAGNRGFDYHQGHMSE